MKMIKRIEIRDKCKSGFLITFPEILKVIGEGSSYYWAILFLDAMGNLGKSQFMRELMKSVNDSENGIEIKWKELTSLSQKFIQIVEAAFIGCKDKINLIRFQTDDEMFKECDVVIIMFDTSWWELGGKDRKQMDLFIKKFENEIRHDLH